jgi:neutral trehalase
VRTSNLIIYIFQSLSEHYANKTIEYINNEGILDYSGGIPTSLENSTEQWDLPNAWPPLQIIVIQGLMYTDDTDANNLAYELAEKWVYANHKGYLDTKDMYEKVRIQYFIEFAHTINSVASIIQMWEPWEPLRSVNY